MAGRFLPGEMHFHTFLSDGEHTLDDISHVSFDKYGLKWLIVTDHGGLFDRDPQGTPFAGSGTKIRGENYGKEGMMWRSQSIEEFGQREIERVRKRHPERLLLHGLEMNLPEGGHAGVFINSSDGSALARFEYIFDTCDRDLSLNLPKHNRDGEGAIRAVRYLAERHKDQSFFIVNHPHVYKAFTPRLIRSLNDAALEVVVGFEGIPGHQYRRARGYYLYEKGEDFRFYRLYGGADYMLAKVGGLWDSLLGEGRRFFVFSGSDFHAAGDDLDPYPGEYSKTYLYLEHLTPEDLIASVRGGRGFVVLGDIIQGLDFTLQSEEIAGLGDELQTHDGKVLLEIKVAVKDPLTLHHIDVIEGEVGERFLPESPGYDSAENGSAQVVLRIERRDLCEIEPGVFQYRAQLNLRFNKGYLRLRGTNLPPNTDFETDPDGNPLIDDHSTRRNTKEIAQNDCWFYTNPIFYKEKKRC